MADTSVERQGPSPAVRLFLCGAAILFWELVLIRWMGACIRIVAYFSNFILLSAFLGLGAGALLAARKWRLEKALLPILSLALVIGPILTRVQHSNPKDNEYIWSGGTPGVSLPPVPGLEWLTLDITVPFWALLLLVFVLNAAVFVVFGQMVGILFKALPPLQAYSWEIGGSVAGIILFGLVSFTMGSPLWWFAIGFSLLLPVYQIQWKPALASLIAFVLVAAVCGPYAQKFKWSPYYKIKVSSVERIFDIGSKRVIDFKHPGNHNLEVNNDYHQMMLNLGPNRPHHTFLEDWRTLYSQPYKDIKSLPPGPILIVGAGTGNDVSAALRNTKREVHAVEIDPMILRLGRELHEEHPYDNPRVTIFNTDARSHFTRTKYRYAMVVFGFLDSHTLLSSFSSLRLDNFVYTWESLERVKELLLPGGRVALTFAVTKPWIHKRIMNLVNGVFEEAAHVVVRKNTDYSNGMVYINHKSRDLNPKINPDQVLFPEVVTPTDNWPFFYMERAEIPSHYVGFLLLILMLSGSSLLLMPAGERRIKMNYFFMGAGFFLIETTNIIKLSILYGSTWIVNLLVFAGILVLVLLGNWTASRIPGKPFRLLFILLFLASFVSYAVAPSMLLQIESVVLQGFAAIALYLGTIYFAALIFAKLIEDEPHLYSAYGSNLLGAMVGGAAEYLSLVAGFRFLVLVAVVFYLLAFIATRTAGSRIAFPRNP